MIGIIYLIIGIIIGTIIGFVLGIGLTCYVIKKGLIEEDGYYYGSKE